MCGIVGIADTAPLSDAHRSCARRMADIIVHRGPDDDGFYDSGYVTLGMRRLAIIDVEGGRQPITNEDETIWAVCNGEIYNFREMRESLVRRGHQFRTQSDVEVIVHLYEEYGDRFVEHLAGMFAIALWDTRTERLLLVRDRVGIKPLYYAVADGHIVFGSEIKSLLEARSVDVRVDPHGLRDCLTMGYSVAPTTLFSGIRKLPPATMLAWEKGAVSQTSYWSIPDTVETGLSEDDWIERIRCSFDDAVASHMVSDVPIGAFLSGGVDSSAIVATMAGLSDRPVNTYSIGYSGDKAASYYNELPFAQDVATRYATRHREIQVKPDIAALLPQLIWHLEEPISDSAITTTFLVAKFAAESVKVILSGVGGDELFAGYNRYNGDHYGSMYARIPRGLRNYVVSPLVNRLPSGRQNKLMDLCRYARSFVRASSLPWRDQYKYYLAIQDRTMLESMLGEAAGDGSGDGFDRVIDSETASDPLLRLLRVDWQTQLSENLLLLTDKMTMAPSLECRVPFLDHRLVELAASIPAGIKRPHGKLKILLKTALEDRLPASVIHRSKRGFGAPVGEWFKGALRPMRSDLLSQAVVESRGLLAWPAVSRICDLHDSNRSDYTDLILLLMNLEIWCRIFVDGRSADDIGGELAERVAA